MKSSYDKEDVIVELINKIDAFGKNTIYNTLKEDDKFVKEFLVSLNEFVDVEETRHSYTLVEILAEVFVGYPLNTTRSGAFIRAHQMAKFKIITPRTFATILDVSEKDALGFETNKVLNDDELELLSKTLEFGIDAYSTFVNLGNALLN